MARTGTINQLWINPTTVTKRPFSPFLESRGCHHGGEQRKRLPIRRALTRKDVFFNACLDVNRVNMICQIEVDQGLIFIPVEIIHDFLERFHLEEEVKLNATIVLLAHEIITLSDLVYDIQKCVEVICFNDSIDAVFLML